MVFGGRAAVTDLREGFRKAGFVLAGLSCFIAAFTLVAVFRGRFAPDEAVPLVRTPEPVATEAAVPMFAPGSQDWMVYVTGAVARPGVYEVSADSRVVDALQAAGGFTSVADPEAINLAARLADGEHVRVPFKGAVPSETIDGEPRRTASKPASAPPEKPRGKLDINRATARELQRLPGVGPTLASQIVEYRRRNGPFDKAEDLCRVKGIGPKRFEVIRDLVTVSGR